MENYVNFLKIEIKKILRKAEYYTKTDMVYLVRGSFWSLLEQGIGSLSSFIGVLALTYVLPKDSFGQYRFILSILPILIIFTLPEMGLSLSRSIARGKTIDLIKIAKEKTKWGLLGALLALILAAYYFYAGNMLIFYALLITSAFIPFMESLYIYIAYYKGNQDFKTAAAYHSISRVFQASVIIITALIFKNVIAILIAYLTGQLIARFVFFRKTVKSINYKEPISGDEENTTVISYGKNLSLLSVVGTIRDNLDKLLVWHFLGAEILAIYYVALTIPNNLVLLFNVLPRIAFPKFAKLTWGSLEYSQLIRKVLLLILGLTLPSILYASLVPFALPIIFKSYHASISPAVIFTVLIFLSPANAMLGQVFYAQKSIKKILILQVFGILVFTSVFFLTYESFKVSGAALALIVSTFAQFIGGIFLIKSTSKTLNP